MREMQAAGLNKKESRMNQIVLSYMLPSGIRISLVQGDITDEQVDAIVNAANRMLAHGGGLAGAIVRKGGVVIQEESHAWVRTHGPVTHDVPAVTGSGALPCKAVIHAVGPVWGEGNEDAKLRMAVHGALRAAGLHRFESIALPAISTGIFGFPKDRAAQVILSAIEDWAPQEPSGPRDIRITILDEPTLAVFREAFEVRCP
jgi:O-acetyl-ADP-ribose deacetylase (regulator of RNase III)